MAKSSVSSYDVLSGSTVKIVLLALTARRMLNYVPFLSALYTGLIKLYVFGHAFLVIHGQCHCKNRGLANAVMGTVVVL